MSAVDVATRVGGLPHLIEDGVHGVLVPGLQDIYERL
jgi:hypothetical protein